MDKPRTLSQAIELGSTHVKESRKCWHLGGCACALGTAMIACGGGEWPPGVQEFSHDIFRYLSKRFGVSRELLAELSWQHNSGTKTRAQIAQWLKKKGL